MHDIAVLGVFEESLFLKIENFSVLRNRLGERLRGLGHWTCSTYAPVLPQLLHAAVDFADALMVSCPSTTSKASVESATMPARPLWR